MLKTRLTYIANTIAPRITKWRYPLCPIYCTAVKGVFVLYITSDTFRSTAHKIEHFYKFTIKIVFVLHQNEGVCWKSIPNAREISRDTPEFWWSAAIRAGMLERREKRRGGKGNFGCTISVFAKEVIVSYLTSKACQWQSFAIEINSFLKCS